MRNKLVLTLALLSLAIATFAGEPDNLPDCLIIPIGSTTAAANASASVFFKVPRSITITDLKVADSAAIAADATDTVAVHFTKDGTTVANFTTTASVGLTAKTPTAMTSTISTTNARVAKDVVLSAEVKKAGSGKATTALAVYVYYLTGWK